MKICPVCSRQYPDDIRFCQDDGTTLRAAAPATSLVGQVVADRYHVIKKLGEGGMGQVYLAEHVKMGRRSAIKVMSPAMVHDPDAVARFNREAANASRITHPNVCAVYDFGETPDGLIYLAMEFVEGEPLTAIIEHEGALPLARATSIFKQTADALQAAHDLGIVHRDLKPDNIMVARTRDGADLVKVVDFGIAKAVGGDDAGQKVTKTGLVVGTPEFMSPEQLSGDKVDGRSDLYSLALVYFRMLTGELPFQADSVQETMVKRLTDDPAKLAETRPDLSFPDGLQQVLDSALARTPGDRYQTVAKFADDVVAVAGLARGTRGVAPATRVDIEGKTQLLDSRETKAQAAKRAPAGRTGVAAAPKRRSLIPIIVGAVVVIGVGGGGYVLLVGRGGGAPAASDTTHRQTATAPDSEKTTALSNPLPANPGGTTKTTQQNASNSGTPGGGQVRDSAKPTPLSHTGGSSINVANASDILDELFNDLSDHKVSASVARDSAEHIFNASGVAKPDKAFAAYVLATAFAQLDDQEPGRGHKATAITWAQRATSLDPASAAYRRLAHDLSGTP
ncbi:MAG TPA: serine/threonine-protein kinase [Gemmatimonadales bacterium]|nr:serine/threonine-protein kinase [Gemmatimonadales bacterium]